jgi:hypothetical protein
MTTEQSPGQTTIDEVIDVDPVNEPDVSEVGPDPAPEAQRQVIIIPGQYSFNSEILSTEGGEFVEFGYGTPIHGGQLYFTRSQLVALGAEMLQLAGKMIPPKQVAKASKLALVERDKQLVDPAGNPL